MTGRASALAGSLGDLSLEDLLHFLAGSHRSGLLELRGHNPGLMAMYDGNVTVAISESGPTLQQVFIGSGITTPDGWDDAVSAASHGTPLVDSFAAAGASDERLRQVLFDQNVGAVFELVLPSDDTFEFSPGETHEVGARFSFDVDELLVEAERRVEAWKIIANAIPSTSIVMRLARSLPGPEVTISSDEWHVLSMVDGRGSIADIIRALGMSAFAVCGVLHRLLQSGVVEAAPEGPGGRGG